MAPKKKTAAPAAQPAPQDATPRCPWCGADPLYQAYHDQEWGKACRDERKMFEFVILESAQSGLSWITILRKREGYRAAFDGFDPEKIALYGPADVERLMNDPRIVRNRRKIEASIDNAKATLALRADGGSLSKLAWSHVDDQPVVNRPASMADVPASTPASTALAKELKARGFKHVGPVVAYSLMQAMGLVDDHLISCAQAKAARSASRA